MDCKQAYLFTQIEEASTGLRQRSIAGLAANLAGCLSQYAQINASFTVALPGRLSWICVGQLAAEFRVRSEGRRHCFERT